MHSLGIIESPTNAKIGVLMVSFTTSGYDSRRKILNIKNLKFNVKRLGRTVLINVKSRFEAPGKYLVFVVDYQLNGFFIFIIFCAGFNPYKKSYGICHGDDLRQAV
jgi:hypothetical protein